MRELKSMAKIVGIDLGSINSNKLLLRSFFGSEFNSHNIGNNGQGNGNNKQGVAYLSAINNLVKLFRSHVENRSSTIAKIILTIPRVMAFVNVAGSRLINPGPIKIKASQPADKLPKIPESTLQNDFLTNLTLAKMKIVYNEA